MAVELPRKPHRDPRRDETEHERLDRNLNELLGELRVALPGVQVLFAFLLTVPFNARFAEVTAFQERLYFATLMSTAISSMLLIAPSLQHRILFRLDEKEYLVLSANKLAIAGLSFLALAICLAVLLVTHVLFGTAAAIAATAVPLGLSLLIWYLVPLRRRRFNGERS
jgi:Family of unknown function (DUF6328)